MLFGSLSINNLKSLEVKSFVYGMLHHIEWKLFQGKFLMMLKVIFIIIVKKLKDYKIFKMLNLNSYKLC